MKDPSAPFASEVERTGLANVPSSVIQSVDRLFSSFLVGGHVVLTRPRPGALFSRTGKKAEHAKRARGYH